MPASQSTPNDPAGSPAAQVLVVMGVSGSGKSTVAALVAERLRLEGEVRAAASRSTLQPIAEQRLQMHVPSDSQVIIITRTPAATHDAP